MKEKVQGEGAQLLEKCEEQSLDKQRFLKLSDNSLFIMDTDLQDEGVYVVKATNPGGVAEGTVKVTVTRPVPPERKCGSGLMGVALPVCDLCKVMRCVHVIPMGMRQYDQIWAFSHVDGTVLFVCVTRM